MCLGYQCDAKAESYGAGSLSIKMKRCKACRGHDAAMTDTVSSPSVETRALISVALEVLSRGAAGSVFSASGEACSGADTLVARDVLESASVMVDVVDMASDMVELDTDSAGSYCADSDFVDCL